MISHSNDMTEHLGFSTPPARKVHLNLKNNLQVVKAISLFRPTWHQVTSSNQLWW